MLQGLEILIQADVCDSCKSQKKMKILNANELLRCLLRAFTLEQLLIRHSSFLSVSVFWAV